MAACYEINCTNVLGLACKGAAILEINEDQQYPKTGTNKLCKEPI